MAKKGPFLVVLIINNKNMHINVNKGSKWLKNGIYGHKNGVGYERK